MSAILESNPFVRMARERFSQDDPDLDALAQELWHRPFSQIPGAKLQFSSILSSDIMRRTLWSEPMFHPWRRVFWSYLHDPSWKSTDAEDTPKLVYDYLNRLNHRDIIMPNTFQMEVFPGMDLQAKVNERCGVFASEMLHFVFPTLPPVFFYATFNMRGADDLIHIMTDVEDAMYWRFFRCFGMRKHDGTGGSQPVSEFFNRRRLGS
ncbi:hypothetical protein ISF_04639 [Cordyceps fumosorosea ARSEF 2679]|uniref:Uncharacterized protein n=1 Tax=Cordyceps fumosorosea (strain ARSEF 2679) TaxID=1081104 RepID=A0A162MLY6_CORFA|nr:hypothetical protein ISF_04639 [Cordyceps fumosorosea ARSEF 2679]OAA63930.1 hypothetical protein ISF_04639 [Cordyceps fumosorosea ARSEF 2679]